jgi:glycosyltransferase involved in cell wall biosynthesis
MRISVIVPVHNEEGSIRALLDGLIAQSFPAAEIVIADGGSTDKTASIIDEYIRRGAPIKLIRGGPGLPGRNRNLAASEARGEWLAFIDAGVHPHQDWLKGLVGQISNRSELDVVYGSYEPIIDSFFRECASIAYVPPAEWTGDILHRTHSIASSLMRRRVWEDVGGFPENLRSAEDLVFMNQVKGAGYRIGYAPAALVYWTIEPGLWQTFKRFVRYSRSNIRAGLWKDWQLPIIKRYALLSLSSLPIIVFGYSWLLVPVVLWILMLAARAFVSIRRNRYSYPAGPARMFFRLIGVIPIIATLDAATFAGSALWVFRDLSGFGTRKSK